MQKVDSSSKTATITPSFFVISHTPTPNDYISIPSIDGSLPDRAAEFRLSGEGEIKVPFESGHSCSVPIDTVIKVRGTPDAHGYRVMQVDFIVAGVRGIDCAVSLGSDATKFSRHFYQKN